MQLSSDPSRRSPTRRLALLSLVFVAAILSCGKDVTGPLGAAARYASGIAWNAIFPPAFQQAGSAAGSLVPFTSVHVVLHHSDGTVALDTTIVFPADSTSYTADLTVKLLDKAPTTGEPMTLDLGYLNAAGVTVFEGGPVAVTAAPPPPGGGANPPVQVPVQYTGPGASAMFVVVAPSVVNVLAGGSFSFSATAQDATHATVPNTPIIWSSLNPSIATITAAGAGLALNQRGSASIVAQLLTGPADTVQVNVSLPASQLIGSSGTGSGSGLTGVVGSTLPLVAKVAASDGVGVGGVTVNFAVASGGGSVTSSAVSDGSGNATATWKLGPTVGTQSVTASAGGLTGSPVTFSATATAATATKLVVSSSPANGVAGVPLSALVVTVEDNNGNVVTGYTDAVSVSLNGSVAGATLGGTTTVSAVAGVATFSGLTVNKVGTGYTISAASTPSTTGTTSTPLTGTTTSAFNIVAGQPAVLVFTAQPASVTANSSLGTIVVNAQDSQGNPTPAFTGTVNLSLANPGGATLGGAISVAAVAGVATFTGNTVSQAGTYTLGASATGLAPATSAAFTITGGGGGGATQLLFTAQPTNTTVPAAISPAITVTAKDALSNIVTTFTGNVTLAFGANPGGSTLGGTLTVAAVAGVATFNGITVSKSATGYTLVATSGALTAATSNTFNIAAGPASTLGITGGQGQTGNTSSPLPTPLAVTILDVNGNAVSGVNVNWTTSGGATMSPTTSATNAAGVATSTWTLGTTPGAQTATATSGTLTGSPATFNATGTLAAFSKTWTGATSTAWTTATNWTPAGVPVAGDSVFIPVGTNQPTISSAVTVKHLNVGFGVLLSFAGSPTVTITGNLTSNGAMAGNGTVAMTGSGTLAGNVSPNITVSGTYSLGALLNAAGSLNVSGSLDMNGQSASVFTTFATAGTGTITMNSASALTVNGNATFGGGSETGLITNGLITVKGNFTQSGATTSFVASGSNAVTLAGTTAQTVSITSPAMSTFFNLAFANTAGFTVSTNLQTNGTLTITSGTAVNGGTNSAHIGGQLTDPGAGLHFASLQFAGTSSPISATTPSLSVSGSVDFTVPSTLAANLTVNGAVTVDQSFAPSGHTLTVNGNFAASGGTAGVLSMTNATDSVIVNGSATFGGGSESGLLTNGVLMVSGNFTQTNNGSGQEFKATSPHLTVLFGSAAQSVTFANPDTTASVCALSCFGDFTIAKTGGTVTFGSAAGANGNVNVNAGVTAVTAIGTIPTSGGSRFLLVRGSTTTAAGTGVHITRFGSFGSVSLDPSTEADTIQFHGTSAQTIPSNEYNEVIIKGSPTVAAGGFTTDGGLTVDGGNLTLGGTAISVNGGFRTIGTGVLTMSNANDSLLVVGQATFAGGVETGNLTNGTLFLFQGIDVQGPNQFNASGNHLTYIVGPQLGCDCPDILVPGVRGPITLSGAAGSAHHGPLTKVELAARRAKAAAKAKGAQASLAAMLAARKALAAKWPSRANAIRAAAAAANTPRASRRVSGSVAATTRIPTNIGIGSPRAPNGGGGVRAASIPVQSYSDTAVYVTFTDTSNQFANVRVAGNAQWNTFARASGKVRLDPTGTVLGGGHLVVGDSLLGASNSDLALEGVELYGVLADTGSFSPDTTVFSGATTQTMPAFVGSGTPAYNNVVVNSPVLGVPADDGYELDVAGSLFIQNSGLLRIGVPVAACNGCESDEVYVSGKLETHGSGALQMTDTVSQPYLAVAGNALFAGGNSTGLLTQGEIYFSANFQQTSTNSTSSYSATAPHQSYFAGYWGVADTITFANPSNTLSHFGNFYLAAQTSVLMSDVFAVGQLQTGNGTGSFTLHAATDHLVTSNGSDIRGLTFDNVRWKTAGTDGNGLFFSFDDVTFQNISATTQPQFDFEYSTTTNITGGGLLSGITFSTVPSGAGVYIKVVGPDTLTMQSPTPALNAGFISVSGGGAVNGWPATVVDNWLGLSTVWNSTTNWSTGLVPTASTDVAISCDCSYPVTNVAAAVHNLSISNGAQLTLGTSSPLTVNGDLTVASNSDISVGSASVTLLGNVAMDPTASPAGITCGTGSTGAILSGSGTQNVTGKFCRLVVNSSVTASGTIVVKNNTAGDAGLTVQTGGAINFNGHRVETDSMYTTGSGTITMTNSADSLVLHGANVGNPVYFNGGSTTGLITNGTIVDHSPYFKASGTAFDAANGLNTIVADSVSYQGFQWVNASVGHGINNLFAKNTSKQFSSDLVITGTLTLDASMTTSGQFAATGYHLYVGQVVDNTGNTNGGLCCAYWVHLTGNGTVPAVVGVDSLYLDYGGNMSLSSNTSTNVLVVNNSTGLYLGGHVLTTNGHDFITQNNAFLAMVNAGDSLNVGTANVFFNGGGFASTLTTGGIAAGGFYQGYTTTNMPASGAAVNSYSPSGTHRLWLTHNAPIIFANPGTGSSLSHFNTLRNPSAYTSTLYSDVFVDDSIYFATAGTAIFNSDQPNTTGKTRAITTKGLANNTSSTGIEFNNVALTWVDGQTAPTNFDNVQWTGFPLLYTGSAFTVNRSTSAVPTLASHDFTELVTAGLLGGHYVNNISPSTGPSLSFTSVIGILSVPSFIVAFGSTYP